MRRRFSFWRSSSNWLLAQLVLGEHLAVGIDDHHARRAVDDEQLVLADQLPRVVQATIAGMLRLRATIAVCEVVPPRSVMKPAN